MSQSHSHCTTLTVELSLRWKTLRLLCTQANMSRLLVRLAPENQLSFGLFIARTQLLQAP
jgi:hypothetical protein